MVNLFENYSDSLEFESLDHETATYLCTMLYVHFDIHYYRYVRFTYNIDGAIIYN